MGTRALQRWPLTGRGEAIDDFRSALRDPACTGMLFYGAAGVGKTRLADECLALVEASGLPVARATASRTAAALPLAALAHLLPPLGDADPVALFAQARAGLEQRFGADRLVLRLDDAHLVDAASAVLIEQLVDDGRVFLLGTVRVGEPVPDLITGLWRTHGMLRVDLDPLGRTNVGTLLHRVLGGPLEATGEAELWDASEGNPLFLSELVHAAIEADTLVQEGGIWRLERLSATSDRLVDLVEARLTALDPQAREALEVLALCQPLGAEAFEKRLPLSGLEQLEASGLVVVTQSRRRVEVTLGHPVHAEVLRATMPAMRSKRILTEEAARIEASGMRRREDALRVATWRLDADGHADPLLLEQAAAVARGAQDFAAVERLARAAHEDEPTASRGLLLGEALYELARFDEAEEVLAAAAELPADDRLRLLLVITRSKNLYWGRPDEAAAVAVLEAARGTFPSVDESDQLLVELASSHAFSSRPLVALDLLGQIQGADDARTRVVRALGLGPTLSALGRTAEAIQVAEEGFAEHLALGDQLAIAHPGSHVVSQAFSLTDAGRLAEAEALSLAGHAVTVADRSIIGQIWFSLNLGRVALLQGRPATARRWYAEGVGLARSTGFDGPRRLGVAGLAIAAGVVGDHVTAVAAAEELDRLPAFAFLAFEQLLAPAWAAVAVGELPRARRILMEGARAALVDGNVSPAARLAHDLARLGGAEDAVPILRDVAEQSDSVLVATFADHAQALARRDAGGLAASVERFEALGALLLAAEAANAAADGWKAKGEQRKAAAMTGRAAVLLAACEGARTPGVAMADSVVPLSPREREVAMLAAEGVASKEIGERLFLSVRTVNNHLQHVYTKLGVTSRPELAAALARTVGGPEEGP